MPVIVLFLVAPLVSLLIALAFYARRPLLHKAAWFALLFFTAWFAYSFRFIGLSVPLLSVAILARLLHRPQQSAAALLYDTLACLKNQPL